MATYRLVTPPEGTPEKPGLAPYRELDAEDRDDGGVSMPQLEAAKTSYAGPSLEEEPEVAVVQAEDIAEQAPDPYAGMSDDFRTLFKAREATNVLDIKSLAEVKFYEEENPEIMFEFVSGPFINNGDGTYDCIFHHPVYGNVPFTANPDDDVPYGRAAHAYILTRLPFEGEIKREDLKNV